MASSNYILNYLIVLFERNQVTEKDIVDLDNEKLISETVHSASIFFKSFPLFPWMFQYFGDRG